MCSSGCSSNSCSGSAMRATAERTAMATTAAATGAAVAGATTGSNKSGSNGSSNCISKGGNISNNMQQRQQQQDIATVSTRALYTIFACRARIADNLNVACQKKTMAKEGTYPKPLASGRRGVVPGTCPPIFNYSYKRLSASAF